MKSRGAMSRRTDPCKLTPYEQQIWSLKEEGKTPRQIAEMLNLSGYNSVYSTIKSAREKIRAQQYDKEMM